MQAKTFTGLMVSTVLFSAKNRMISHQSIRFQACGEISVITSIFSVLTVALKINCSYALIQTL